jgi:hypothetical protein
MCEGPHCCWSHRLILQSNRILYLLLIAWYFPFSGSSIFGIPYMRVCGRRQKECITKQESRDARFNTNGMGVMISSKLTWHGGWIEPSWSMRKFYMMKIINFLVAFKIHYVSFDFGQVFGSGAKSAVHFLLQDCRVNAVPLPLPNSLNIMVF